MVIPSSHHAKPLKDVFEDYPETSMLRTILSQYACEFVESREPRKRGLTTKKIVVKAGMIYKPTINFCSPNLSLERFYP